MTSAGGSPCLWIQGSSCDESTDREKERERLQAGHEEKQKRRTLNVGHQLPINYKLPGEMSAIAG